MKMHESVSAEKSVKAGRLLIAARAAVAALSQNCTFPADITAAENYLKNALK